jgi:peptidoglycan-binding protein ArfA
MKDAAASVGGMAADDAQAEEVRAGLRAVPSSFKVTDQIHVREPPKPESKPQEPAAPQPDATPAQQTAPAATPRADDAAAKLASPAPPAAAPAPPVPEPAPPAAPPAPAPPAEAAPQAAPSEPKAAAACREDLVKLAGASTIAFERGSAKVEAAGVEALNRIAAAAKACPGVRLAVEGHADIEGIAEYNQRLSVRRAEAVAEVLVAAGVGAAQVETAGFGTSRPVVPNTTPQALAKNRRTEIVVRP